MGQEQWEELRHSGHMVNSGSHGAIVPKQWGKREGKEQGERVSEREKGHCRTLAGLTCERQSLHLESGGRKITTQKNSRLGQSAVLWSISIQNSLLRGPMSLT